MRQSYRVFLERKTRGAPPWRVELADRHIDADHVEIRGACRTRYDEGKHNAFSVAGTGVITPRGDGTVVITESEA